MKVPAKIKKILFTAFRVLTGEAWEIGFQLINTLSIRLRIKKLSRFLHRRIRPCFKWGIWLWMIYSIVDSGGICDLELEAESVWNNKSLWQPIGQLLKGAFVRVLPSSIQSLMKKFDRGSQWFNKARKNGGKLASLLE